MTETQKYDVYTLECLGSCDEWFLVPLKQVLHDPALLYGDKLHLAWMIACGVLQMQGTPWVADIPRSEDIFIAQKGGVHQFQHVFVLRHFPEYPRVNSASSTNPFMLYLGILLIELILGQSIATLDSPQNQTLEHGLPRHILVGTGHDDRWLWILQCGRAMFKSRHANWHGGGSMLFSRGCDFGGS